MAVSSAVIRNIEVALRRNLAQSLFEHGRIKTTLPKAKEVQGFVEKLITAARKGVNATGEDVKGIKLNAVARSSR